MRINLLISILLASHGFLHVLPTTIDLNTPLSISKGFQIIGAGAGHRLGTAVSSAGDINKDGYSDIIIGAVFASPSGRTSAGTAYILYGKPNGQFANIDMSTTLPLSQGFQVDGAVANSALGRSVSYAGDVNNDGYDDIVIGAYGFGISGRGTAGAAYVIYGKPSGRANIDVSTLALSDGFRILGAEIGDQLGLSVSAAGDVNNDGYDDIVVGAYQADPSSSRANAGAAYVIYGKPTAQAVNIDLSTALPLTQGFKISGNQAGDNLGWFVSASGDVNNDGYDDVIVAAHQADPSTRTNAGTAYVIYGRPTAMAANIDLVTTLPLSQGFEIYGGTASDFLGTALGRAGDMNNDGYDDVVIGARNAQPFGRAIAGAAYVIYGKPNGVATHIDLATQLPLSHGFQISGAEAGDSLGSSTRYAGDINKDGYDDLIIGAWYASPSGRSQAGSAYVIYGKPDGMNANIDLNAILASSQGFKIDGSIANDNLGYSVACAGDINNDGVEDLIFGAYSASRLGRPTDGAAYVIFSDLPPCATVYCSRCAGSRCLECDTDYLLYTGDNKCYFKTMCPAGTSPNSTHCVDTLIESIGAAQQSLSQAAGLIASAVTLISFNNPGGLLFAILGEMLTFMKYMSITYPPRLQTVLNQPDDQVINIQYISSAPQEAEDEIPTFPLADNFEKYGIPSSFLINFWSSLTKLSLVIIGIGIAHLSRYATKRWKSISSQCVKVRQALQWNYLIGSFAGCYGLIAFYSSFEFKTASAKGQFESFLEVFSFTICLLMNIVLLAFTVKVSVIIKKLSGKKDPKEQEKRKQKLKDYQIIFDSFKSESLSQQSYFLTSCVRFYFFYTILGYMFEHPLTQAIIINIQGLIFISYIAITRPFESKFDFGETLILESILQIINSCVLGLAIIDRGESHISDNAIRLGDAIIVCFLMFSAIQSVYSIVQLVTLAISCYKYIRQTLCLKKRLRMSPAQKLEISAFDDSITTLSTSNISKTYKFIKPRLMFISPLQRAVVVSNKLETSISTATLETSSMFEVDSRMKTQKTNMRDTSMVLSLSPFLRQRKK